MIGSRCSMMLALSLSVVVGQPQHPTFKSAIEMVEVDVRVTDRSGRFVADLSAGELEIFEEGVAQQLKTFLLVTPPSVNVERARSHHTAPQVWIFVFDDRNMDGSGLRRARSAAEAFISNHLPGGDLATVVYRDRVILNRISSARSEILSALKEVRLPGETPAAGGASAFAAKLLLERGIHSSLGALDGLATQLRRVPGPKAIVYFSDGFPLHMMEGTLRNVVQRIVEAGARLYAIDTRGLVGGEPASTLNSLARDTGGLFLFNYNNIGKALERVHLDAAVYYVLGYVPTPPVFNGQFRRLQVRVKRSDVIVRARHGYFAADRRQMRTVNKLIGR